MGSKTKNNRKGFTLVEVIVVLVILAILAAISIPSLTGYIDDAKEKSAMMEAQQILVAAQAVASEKYATATTPMSSETIADGEIKKMLGTTDFIKDFTFKENVKLDDSAKVLSFKIFLQKSKKYVAYNATDATKPPTFTVSNQ